MKTSDIKVNTLISFNYKKTHPKKDRLFYVTKIEANTILGVEFSDRGSPLKKFLTAHITNLALVPSAKLPIEAEDYAYEIFANIFKEYEENIRMEEVGGELVGYVTPSKKSLTGSTSSNTFNLTYNNKSISLIINSDGIREYGNSNNLMFKTPHELAQYILTNLS